MRSGAALLLLACTLLDPAGRARADDGWAGSWDVERSDGGGRLVLEQQDDRVKGAYQPQDGRIEARTEGRRLIGTWSEGDQSGAIELLLGPDGRSFAGRGDVHGWWTGRRYGARHEGTALPALDLATPRDALLDFLLASNVARAGDEEAWGVAEKSVEFAPGAEPVEPSERLRAVREFFEMLDLATVVPSDVPTTVQGDTVVVPLDQPGTEQSLDVTIRRDATGAWHVVVPPQSEVVAARKRLLAAWGASPPSEQSFRKLRNPRDTLRSLLEGMDDWAGSGRDLALSTMDLSRTPDIAGGHGALLAQYLRRTLQNVGLPALQAVPNDPSNRDPWVQFSHADGEIVIAPTGPGEDAPWQFTADTLERIQDLYLATDGLSPAKRLPPGRIPPHSYFTLRAAVAEHAPFLLGRVGWLDRWQALVALLLAPLAFLFGNRVGRVAARREARGGPEEREPSRALAWSIAYLVGVAILTWTFDQLGFPERLRRYNLPILGSLACIAAGVVAWHLLDLLGRHALARAQRTPGEADDIAVNLLVAGGRVLTVVAAALGVSNLLSIPATHILTGLGIGGLALAVAARDTLANILGAGNLVTDRPFRAGDWIDAGIVQGSVESVGMRSTRIRTAEDSVAVIPNGRLSDALINNLGARRHRVVKLRLPVTEGATPDRLQEFVEAIRARIVGDGEFVARETEVGVTDVENGGVPVVVKTYLVVKTDAEEVAARHALLVDLLRIAEEHHLRLGAGMQSTQAKA